MVDFSGSESMMAKSGKSEHISSHPPHIMEIGGQRTNLGYQPDSATLGGSS